MNKRLEEIKKRIEYAEMTLIGSHVTEVAIVDAPYLLHRVERLEAALNRIIRHANMEDENGEFLDPHPLAIREVAEKAIEEIEKIKENE